MNNPWNVDITAEREFITKNIIGTFIQKPEICPICETGKIGFKNNNSINNPIQYKCNNYKCCRNISIRKDTIFEYNPRTPFSVLFKIMNLWIVDSFNALQIKKKLEEDYNLEKVDSRFIYNFLFNCRRIIASYLRNVYALERLVNTNANQIVCVDESLFTHQEGQQTWVVGIINTTNNNIRLEIVPDRTEVTLKTIIERHVGKGNAVFTDTWAGYNFLGRPNSGYIHNFVNHSNGVFGLTSKIEGIWSELKTIIKKIYISIHGINFGLFLREAEYRRSLRNLNNREKLNALASVISSTPFEFLLDEKDQYDINYDVSYDE